MVSHHGRSHFNAARVSESTGIPVHVILGIVIFIKGACIACCCIRTCRKKQGNNDNNGGVVLQQANMPSNVNLQNNLQTTIPVNPTLGYLAPYQNNSSDNSKVFVNSNQNVTYPPVYPMPPIGMNPPYTAQYPTYPVVNANQADIGPNTDNSFLNNISVNPNATTEAYIHHNAGTNITDAAHPITNINHFTENQNPTNVTDPSHMRTNFTNNDANPTCTVEMDNIQSFNKYNPGIKTNNIVNPNGIEINSNGLTSELTVNTMDLVQPNHSINPSTNQTTNNVVINPVSTSGENVIPVTRTP